MLRNFGICYSILAGAFSFLFSFSFKYLRGFLLSIVPWLLEGKWVSFPSSGSSGCCFLAARWQRPRVPLLLFLQALPIAVGDCFFLISCAVSSRRLFINFPRVRRPLHDFSSVFGFACCTWSDIAPSSLRLFAQCSKMAVSIYMLFCNLSISSQSVGIFACGFRQFLVPSWAAYLSPSFGGQP